jgi:outer membrane protein OmpA-like peptidoglycan-associated protein
MSSIQRWGLVRAMALAGFVGVCASGCATRGFVRNEVRTLGERVDRNEQALGQTSNEARTAHDLARGGDARAREAQLAADLARDLALGNVRREEIRRTTVNFAFNSATLKDEGKSTLDGVADEIKAHPNYMVLLSGYTDATGSAQYNVGLAQRRAESVQLYLAERLGPDFIRIAQIGLGEIQPVAENSTSEGRKRNRRVEVSIVKPVPAGAMTERVPADEDEKTTEGQPGPS